MFYLVYKTTNTINGKYYVGCHQTSNKDDGYIGSGRLLLRAISKYGASNFVREILFECSSVEEMFIKESEIVDAYFITLDETYNLKIGGEGGWDFINRTKLAVPYFTKSNAKILSLAANEAKRQKHLDPEYLARIREKHSVAAKKAGCGGMLGNHSDDTKARMRISHIGKHAGNKNSQFGTCWITNGIQSKKTRIDTPIENGWVRGRKINGA